MSDDTSTKSTPDVAKPAAAKPTAAKKPAPKKVVDMTGFGDPPLGGALVEPVGFDKRDRKTREHVFDIVGLVLSPPQLALAVTALPLASNTKPSIIALLAGLVAGAIATVLVQVPLLRYGLTLGVLARTVFGWRGAKLFVALRALAMVAFFGTGVYLAAQTLQWCVLCAAPALVPWLQRVPLLGSASLVLVCLTILAAIFVWLFSSRPSPRVRVLLLLPALALVALLAFLPDNLPMGTALGMLDVAGRAESTNVYPVFSLAFVWSVAVFLSPSSETRLQSTQISQTMAVAAGVLPWLGGAMALLLAVLSTGQSDGGFFDIPALACRRLNTPLLIAVLACAAVTFVWPLAHVTKRATLIAVQELLGGRAKGNVLRIAEYTLLALGLVAAMAAHTAVPGLLDAMLVAQGIIVAACLLMVVQYFAVDRTKLVLDELFTLRYGGFAGVLPAGFLSLGLGAGVLAWGQRQGYPLPAAAGFGLLIALVGQALFGNMQKLLLRRRLSK